KQAQIVSAGSLVIRLDRKVSPKPALDSGVVLIDIGAANIGIFGAESDQAAGRRAGTLLSEVRDERHALIEANGPGELVRLSNTGGLRSGQIVGRIQAHVGWDIV